MAATSGSAGAGTARGIIDLDHDAIGFVDFVSHAGRGSDEF
jgi:hypothetical protein